MSRQLELLRIHFGSGTTFPDPAEIESASQWYLLGHLSSSLANYDHLTRRFVPTLATFETVSPNKHIFRLLENAKFSDASLITAVDVIASMKRLLIRKSSTHFPMWDYLVGSANLSSMHERCKGLVALDDRTIQIELTHPVDSFLLQMASPETGIWCSEDIDDKTLAIKPRKFSGPYALEKLDDTGFLLVRNHLNAISKRFPDSPKRIQVSAMKSVDAIPALIRGEVDAVVRSYDPYSLLPGETLPFKVFSSARATLIYLHGSGTEKRKVITRKLIEKIWQTNTDPGLEAADNFMAFDPRLSITREEFLAELPQESSHGKTARVGVPWTWLSPRFYTFLKNSSQAAGLEFEIIALSKEEWFAAILKGERPKQVDFILGVYAASERYPAVQLRYITGSIRGPSIDLKEAESPDLDTRKQNLLKDYQKKLLADQYAIPLFFTRYQISFKGVDVGEQPLADAELEMWRFTKV